MEDNTFEARLTVTHYNDLPGELFGEAEELVLELAGAPLASEMDLAGVFPERPDHTRYTIRLRRLSPTEAGAD